jgi:hypothetical protein
MNADMWIGLRDVPFSEMEETELPSEVFEDEGFTNSLDNEQETE